MIARPGTPGDDGKPFPLLHPECELAVDALHREVSNGHNTPGGAKVDPEAVRDKIIPIVIAIESYYNNLFFRKWLYAHG